MSRRTNLLCFRVMGLIGLLLLGGLLAPGLGKASDDFLADLANSRRIDIDARQIIIYLARPDLEKNRVAALYPYVRRSGAANYQLEGGSRTRFRLKDAKGGYALVVNRKSFPVNVLDLPQPPSTVWQ